MQHAIDWNPFFPKPGDLRLSIRDELADHYRREREERLAALPKPIEEPPPSPEDVAYVDGLVAKLKISILAKGDVLQAPNGDEA